MRIEKEITVIEKNGKYWGIEYADGHCTCYGWLDSIEGAKKVDPEYCIKPTDVTHRGDRRGIEELSTARLVTYKVVSEYTELK